MKTSSPFEERGRDERSADSVRGTGSLRTGTTCHPKSSGRSWRHSVTVVQYAVIRSVGAVLRVLTTITRAARLKGVVVGVIGGLSVIGATKSSVWFPTTRISSKERSNT